MNKYHKCSYCNRNRPCTIQDQHDYHNESGEIVVMTCEEYDKELSDGLHNECYSCMEDRWREEAYEESGGGFW